MNDQIQQLFDQTTLHRNDHTTEQRRAEVAKLVRLVVRQCTNMFDNAPNSDEVYTPIEIRQALTLYFGVE